MEPDDVPTTTGAFTGRALTALQAEALRRSFVHDFNAVVITDGDVSGDGPHVIVCNPAFLTMTGYTEDELVGRNLRMVQGPGTDPRIIDRLRECLLERRFFEGETLNYRKDGSPYLVRWNISPVLDGQGEVEYFTSVQQERTREARALRDRELLVRALEVASDPVFVTDPGSRITFASRGLAQLVGHDPAQLVGRHPSEFDAEDPLAAGARLRDAVASRTGFRSTCRWRHLDGGVVDVDVTVTVVLEPDGTVGGLVHTAKDITLSVRRERALQAQATTDVLTGLLTRRAGEAALAALDADSTPYAVLLGDIDHFKDVNDTHGHHVGDTVLQRVASTIRHGIRAQDAAVRWGGEEVIVLVPGVDEGVAARMAERLRAAVAATSVAGVGGVTISIGVATGGPGTSTATVVAQADAALYAAKRAGRNRVGTSA